MINKLKKHKWLILIFFILFISFYINSYFDLNTTRKAGENFFFRKTEVVRQSIKSGEFPHWVPHYYGGTPFFANSQNYYFDLLTLVATITPSMESNLKVHNMLLIIIASISLYFLMLELNIKPQFAVISVIIYIFNHFVRTRFIIAQINEGIVISYLWIPLISLLTVKFIKSKNYKEGILYSILAGIAFAIQFHSGYPATFVYTTFLMVGFLSIYVILSGLNIKLITKITICGLIMFLVLLGLGAIKILPLLEYSTYSSLSGPRTFENAKGFHFEIRGIKDIILKPIMALATEKLEAGGYMKIAIGIIPLLFLFFSLSKYRNKYIIISFILIVIMFLVASGSFLFYLLWKFYIGFGRQHHIGRILAMVPLLAAIMVGIGAQSFFNTIKKKYKLNKWLINVIYSIILLLVLINLHSFQTGKQFGYTYGFQLRDALNQNELFQFFVRDNDIFRVHNIKDVFVGSVADLYAVPLKQEIILGAVNVWIPEYINEYFGTYLRLAPYKFLGMLNTKYVYSNEELNESDLKFLKKFNRCKICIELNGEDGSNDGPYLYLNKLYLPRAYMVKEAILVIGDYNEAKGTMYLLMINNNFNPASTVIIMKEGLINNYDLNFLKKFRAIILTKGSIDQNSGYILKDYKDSGGILLPDIIDGKNTITEEDINRLLTSFKGDYKNIKKLNITHYSPNKREIKLNDENGFLVLSEKFFMFEGWKANINNKNKEILRANGINSAIYTEETGNLTLEYKSKSFKRGMIISLTTLIMIIIYLAFHFFYLKQKNKT